MNPFDMVDAYQRWLLARPCLERIEFASHDDGRWTGYLYNITPTQVIDMRWLREKHK